MVPPSSARVPFPTITPRPPTPSERVDATSRLAIQSVQAQASQDTTGPEANYQRDVRALAATAQRDLAVLEAATPKDTSAIAARVDRFSRDLEQRTLTAGAQIKAARVDDRAFVDALPPYLKSCVENKGVAIPRTNLGVRPRFDDGFDSGPTGANVRLRF